MISVRLEQEFLPTDTVVDIPKILNQIPEMVGGSNTPLLEMGLMILGAVLLVTCLAGIVEYPEYDKIHWTVGVVGIAILGAGITTFISDQNDYKARVADYQSRVAEFNDEEEAYYKLVDEQREKNRENLITNIESVYDIDKIEIDSEGVAGLTGAMAEGKIGDKVVTKRTINSSVKAVIFQDGKAYDVLVSQDPDTYEPLLSVHTTVNSDAPVIRKK